MAALAVPRMNKMSMTVIDGDGLILGRMASIVAKRLLAGEKIEIVNAENIVVSGNRHMILKKEHKFLEVGGHGKGPIHYRQPHRMVRRTIRGMLPYRKDKGKKAFSRLKVHIGVPEELETAEKAKMPEVHSSNLNRRFVTIGVIAESIGWKK
ncbi:MAG: 50S ribosomal protein L13 [Candidatus Bathyarchaeota archaeon]|nr:50S ribosomal protein L13 [Candidatus Bathyarchaeota archaeon]